MKKPAAFSDCSVPPILLLIFSILLSSGALANEWPAKYFQVVAREPTPAEVVYDAEELDYLDQAASWFGDDGNTQTNSTLTAGQWTTKIGGFYLNAGHKAPVLGPIVEDSGVAKYRIYMFPFAGSRTRDAFAIANGTYENNGCPQGNKKSWLSLNDKGSTLSKPTFGTISHEMMHALMAGDAIRAHCNRNSFEVSEGIPDGASLYLLNKQFDNYSGNLDISNSGVGLRSYKLPFFFFNDTPGPAKSQLEQKTGYLTGSFWYFIAERFGGLKVFPHFLKSPIINGASQNWMYSWLEERLQTLPGLQKPGQNSTTTDRNEPVGLYEVYPAFVTEFASYGAARYMGFAHQRWASWQQARDVWLSEAFGGCKKIELTPGQQEAITGINVERNAAACLRVRYSGFKGNIRSRIEVKGESLAKVDQLHLGWAWKIGLGETENCYKKRLQLKSKWPPCIYKAYAQTGPQMGSYVRTWPTADMDFNQSDDGIVEWIYILSNVAVDPSKTAAARGLILTVAVSDSNVNGQPAEPVDQLNVSRKQQSPVNPMKPVGKEELYGLQTDPPTRESGLKGLSLTPYRASRSDGSKEKAKPGYGITIIEMKYGTTGPVIGTVALTPSDTRMRQSPVASNLCSDPSRPIGQITRSDEQSLQILIDTDLCQARVGDSCENGCPVIEHATAEVNIAYGWRQFGTTAPTDIRTAGIQRYINTMPDSLAEAMNFGANTELPDTDRFEIGPDSGTTPAPGGEDNSSDVQQVCACSCDELASFDKQAEEFKSKADSGGNSSMSFMGRLSQCSSQCQREYMICRLDASNAEKEQRKA
jgi:hypothetical protein